MSAEREYGIPETDEELVAACDVTTFVASGPGGQHRNRNKTAIRLHHRPSGIVVIGRRERSLARNRADAIKRLRAKLEAAAVRPKTRRPTKPTKGARERRLDKKRRNSARKQLRRPVKRDD